MLWCVLPRVVWSRRMRQVSAAMRSRRGASTHTQVRSYLPSELDDRHSASAHECLCFGVTGLEGFEGGFAAGYRAALSGGLNPHSRYGPYHTNSSNGTPTGAAQHGTARHGCDRLGGDAHGSWSLPSHSRLGGDGEGAPAGGSAGGSKTELNSHSRYARATQPRSPRQSRGQPRVLSG